MAKRKFVRISVALAPAPPEHPDVTIYFEHTALADDGSAWSSWCGGPWQQLPPLPDSEGNEALADASARLEDQRKQIAKLIGALEPFAFEAGRIGKRLCDSFPWAPVDKTVGDFRRARQAIDEVTP